MLNSSLFNSTKFVLKRISNLKSSDLNNFSILYFLNVTMNNISSFKKIIEFKLFNLKLMDSNLLILDQNNTKNNNKFFSNKIINNSYSFIPSSMFYENDETFFNTEGFIKKITKVIFKKTNKNSWQILRKFLKYLKKKLTFLSLKENQLLSFNLKKFYNFRNYTNFQYYATQSLTNLSFYLNLKNNTLFLKKNNFKFKTEKFIFSKLKYWLDDFFIGGNDCYSQNSMTLTNCSKILRFKHANFF